MIAPWGARDVSGSEAPQVIAEPTISVLMPVRDGGRYLAPAVADVLAQRDLEQRDIPLELVAIDDGSRDGSGERLEQLARQDARLRVIRTEGVGPAQALELGRAAAR